MVANCTVSQEILHKRNCICSDAAVDVRADTYAVPMASQARLLAEWRIASSYPSLGNPAMYGCKQTVVGCVAASIGSKITGQGLSVLAT